MENVVQELFVDVVPGLPLLEPQVDVRRGELGSMEPDVDGEGVLDKVLVLILILALIDQVPVGGLVLEHHR